MPRIGLLTIALKISEEEKRAMARKMVEYRSKRLERRKRRNNKVYKVGDKVRIFCPNYKKFQEQGTIDSVIPHDNGALPASHMVIVNGVKRKVNQTWIARPHVRGPAN